MSQENVEMLVRAFEAWNRDDMDAMLALVDPDFEYVPTGMFPGMEPVYRGHDGFLAFWDDFREVWESLQIEVEEVRDLGEQVVARLRFEGRGRAGLDVRRQFGNLWTFRNGLAVHVQAYADWPEALQAAGLSE